LDWPTDEGSQLRIVSPTAPPRDPPVDLDGAQRMTQWRPAPPVAIGRFKGAAAIWAMETMWETQNRARSSHGEAI